MQRFAVSKALCQPLVTSTHGTRWGSERRAWIALWALMNPFLAEVELESETPWLLSGEKITCQNLHFIVDLGTLVGHSFSTFFFSFHYRSLKPFKTFCSSISSSSMPWNSDTVHIPYSCLCTVSCFTDKRSKISPFGGKTSSPWRMLALGQGLLVSGWGKWLRWGLWVHPDDIDLGSYILPVSDVCPGSCEQWNTIT